MKYLATLKIKINHPMKILAIPMKSIQPDYNFDV